MGYRNWQFATIAVALTCMTHPAFAAEPANLQPGFVRFETEADFDTVTADLQDAIVNLGLVIDYTGNVGGMLARTADVALGDGGKSPYSNAVYMHFCSAALTHEVVAADPQNLAACPYVVFAYETLDRPGTVNVGYRRPVVEDTPANNAATAKIDTLLREIVEQALQ